MRGSANLLKAFFWGRREYVMTLKGSIGFLAPNALNGRIYEMLALC